MKNYGEKVQEEGKRVGEKTKSTLKSPGFKKAATYTKKDVDKHCSDIKKYLKQ